MLGRQSMSNHSIEPTDGLNAAALLTAGIVAAIGTFVIVVGLQVLYLLYSREYVEPVSAGPNAARARALLAEQRSKMNRYGWLDQAKDVVAVPIGRAIALTAGEIADGSTAEQPQPRGTRGSEGHTNMRRTENP